MAGAREAAGRAVQFVDGCKKPLSFIDHAGDFRSSYLSGQDSVVRMLFAHAGGFAPTQGVLEGCLKLAARSRAVERLQTCQSQC